MEKIESLLTPTFIVCVLGLLLYMNDCMNLGSKKMNSIIMIILVLGWLLIIAGIVYF